MSSSFTIGRFIISVLLLVCIAVAGLTGYLQVRLDLHRFVLHRYFAYAGLILTAVHCMINGSRISGYRRLLRKKAQRENLL